ncbi:MAG: hypothetical protein P8X81_12540 [Woeseiaceae bacterium]
MTLWLGLVETGPFIKNGHVCQTDAAALGRLADCLEHGAFLATAASMVEVVKLGDRGVAARDHLDVGLPSDDCQRFGIQLAGECVHALAPAPEIVMPFGRALLGAAGKRPLECVAVSIAQPGNHDAGLGIRFTSGNAGFDRFDMTRAYAEPDVVCPALINQCLTRKNRVHHGPVKLYIQARP